MVHYVYMIQMIPRKANSFSIGKIKYYTGETNNIWRRYSEALQKMHSKYLNSRKNTSMKLVYVETVADKKAGLKREQQIKAYPPFKKEQLIKSKLNKLVKLEVNFGILKELVIMNHANN